MLSVRVRELVFEKQSTTYKEVADDLIQELIKEGKMPSDKKNVWCGEYWVEQGREKREATRVRRTQRADSGRNHPA